MRRFFVRLLVVLAVRLVHVARNNSQTPRDCGLYLTFALSDLDHAKTELDARLN